MFELQLQKFAILVLYCVLLVWTSWYICPVLCWAEYVKGKKSSWASGSPPPHSLSNHARPKTLLPHPSPSSSSMLLCFSIVAFFCRARPLKQIGEVTQNQEYTEPWVGNGQWAVDEWDIERGIRNIPVQQGGKSRAKWQVWIWTKILSPNIRYFVAILRFVEIYAHLEDFGQKKGISWSKAVFLGHYDVVYINCMS